MNNTSIALMKQRILELKALEDGDRYGPEIRLAEDWLELRSQVVALSDDVLAAAIKANRLEMKLTEACSLLLRMGELAEKKTQEREKT